MNPLALFWHGESVIFHVRAGGCGGCGDNVDNWIRFSRGMRRRPVECASPRHADIILVTGCRSGLFSEAVRSVIEQAPKGCRVLFAGDCALGRGPLETGDESEHTSAGDISADVRIEGCPVDDDSVVRGVKRCLGWS